MPLFYPARQRSAESADLGISRADWRFLLPNPFPGNTICLVDGTLARTVQLFSETTLYPGNDAGHSDYDLAVLKNPDDAELGYAISILKPGACCYVEWDVGVFFSPSAITKKLETAGFESVEHYMPKPNPDITPPGIWIPLESYGAVNFLLNSNYKAQPASRRTGKMFLNALWSLSPAVFIKFPWLISSGRRRLTVCSIASKPGKKDGGDVKNIFKSRLAEVMRLLPDDSRGDRSAELSTMIISGGMHRLNKVVLVVFSGDSPKPSFIVKIPRTGDSESALVGEAGTLRALTDEHKFTNGIPRVLYSDHRLGFFSVGETYIDGRFLGEVRDVNKLPGYAKKLTDWLIDLAKKTAARMPVDWRNAHISPLAEVLDRAMPDPTDRNIVDKAVDTIKSLEIPAFVCEHRDFAPWNILLTADGQFGVLDWESSRMDGIPGLDLIYFLTYLCIYIEEAWTTEKALECYKKMLDSDTYLGRMCRDSFNSYANEVGLSPQSYKPLRIMTWATHLASVSSRLEDENLYYGEASHEARSLFLRLIEYEMSGS
ncbi:MAG: aminoglycoside phosphotransferase family protein [Thermodesulfobacteriota bacterium]